MSTSTMSVLGPEGDTKTIWDATNPDEVAAAKATFDTLVAKGFQAYRVDDEGDRSELIREFDPEAERMILRPAMQGG